MDDGIQANPHYAAAALAKALKTAQIHPDQATRERAAKKGDSWMQVLTGMASGLLQVGSRRPSSLPVWVTLEVLRGGFATGNPLAGGPSTQVEQAMAAERNLVPERTKLNEYFLSPAGLDELQTWLSTGHYQTDLPEEAALLSVAWLAQAGDLEGAAQIVKEIAPYFSKLRFYPRPSIHPQSLDRLQLQSPEQVSRSLSQLQNRRQFLLMREVISTWLPFQDRLISLALETVTGELPSVENHQLLGGWPLQQFPEGWQGRANALLSEFENQARKSALWKPKGDFLSLVDLLRLACSKPSEMSGREVGKLRRILANYIRKRGLPGSNDHAALRKQQQDVANLPGRADWVPLLQQRLIEVASLEAKGEQAVQQHLLAPTPEGRAIPPGLASKLLRCWKASPEALAAAGVIRSGETLAKLLPQVSSQVPGSQFSNQAARQLFEATYVAFRKRRSLLLLRLESQVKFNELPWMSALLKHADRESQQFARQTLERFLSLYFQCWPQVILPNKFVKELFALSKLAQLELPLLEQLAADIFMGAFSEKFLRSAQDTARLLGNSLYQRYYNLDLQNVLDLNDLQKTYGTLSSPGFLALCESLAGTKAGKSLVGNGKIIEQAQILTSHNLAVLWNEFQLGQCLSAKDLASYCFGWVCRAQTLSYSDWRSNLKARSRCANAWRQMVFYLSTLSEPEVQDFFVWAKTRLRNPKLDSSVGVWLEDLHRSFNGEARISRPLLGWVTKADLNKN
jgi:hypothetical protein